MTRNLIVDLIENLPDLLPEKIYKFCNMIDARTLYRTTLSFHKPAKLRQQWAMLHKAYAQRPYIHKPHLFRCLL